MGFDVNRVIDNGKVEEIISYSQLGDHLEATANEENETNDGLYKLRALISHQGPLKATDPKWKGCKYNILVEWETGEKTYEPLSVLAADDPVTCASYAKKNGLSHTDGWERFKNLAKRDEQDLSSIASPKGRGRVLSVGLFFSRVPHQALYVLLNLHLESSINSSCCVIPHQALYVTLDLQSSMKKLSFVSPCTFLFVTLLFILELLSLCQDLLLKQTDFLTVTPA